MNSKRSRYELKCCMSPLLSSTQFNKSHKQLHFIYQISSFVSSIFDIIVIVMLM